MGGEAIWKYVSKLKGEKPKQPAKPKRPPKGCTGKTTRKKDGTARATPRGD
jgi:hypothetical protein